MADKTASKGGDPVYILAYLFSFVSGIVIYASSDERKEARRRFHSMQAILMGLGSLVVSFVMGIIPIVNLFAGLILAAVWVYGVYVGLEAYNGRDIVAPVVGSYSMTNTGYTTAG